MQVDLRRSDHAPSFASPLVAPDGVLQATSTSSSQRGLSSGYALMAPTQDNNNASTHGAFAAGISGRSARGAIPATSPTTAETHIVSTVATSPQDDSFTPTTSSMTDSVGAGLLDGRASPPSPLSHGSEDVTGSILLHTSSQSSLQRLVRRCSQANFFPTSQILIWERQLTSSGRPRMIHTVFRPGGMALRMGRGWWARLCHSRIPPQHSTSEIRLINRKQFLHHRTGEYPYMDATVEQRHRAVDDWYPERPFGRCIARGSKMA